MTPSEPLRLLGLPPRIAAGFGAAILTLVVAAVASYAALSEQASAGVHVRHTAAARLAIEEVESSLLVSHTAMEAYLAGGDPRHHAQFLKAAAMVQPAFESLRALAGDHPEQIRRIAELALDVETVRAGNARLAALIEAGDLGSARATLAGGPAPQAYERVRASLDDLEEEERAHEGREAAWARSVLALNVIFVAAVSALLLLVIAGARLVREEIRRREAHADERERALVVQRRLMAVVSHDLRNPLNVILAGGWALSRGDRSPEATRLACRIVGAGQRMARLIRDVLDWSRLHGGASIPICTREADLHELCRRVADEQCERDGERVQLEREGDTRAVFDPDRIEQVVGNLLCNALRHGPAGSPVRVRTIGTADEVRVEVQDEGPGIPAAARGRIFEPFRREPGASASGVGLGLFIARALAEAHGGGVDLDPAAAKTTFVVRLPRYALTAPCESSPDATPAPGFVRGLPSPSRHA